MLPEIGRDLTLSAGELGLLMGAFGLGRVLADLPAGRVAGAGASRAGLAAAGASLAAGLAALALAQSLALAMLGLAVAGSASALTNTLGMYAFATRSRPERRGAGMAAYSTALMAGLTVGPALGGLAASALGGWRGAMGAAAGIGVLIAVGSLAGGRRGGAPIRDERIARGDTALAPDAGVALDARAGGGAGPRRSELAVISSVPFVTFMAYGAIAQTLVPIVGDDRLGLAPSTVGIVLATAGSTRFLSAWVAGTLSDRLSRKVVLAPVLVLTALSAVLLGLPGTVPWVAAIMTLGLGSSSMSVAAAALADRVPRGELGNRLGLFRVSGDTGLLVGPVAAAVLYETSGAALAGAFIAAPALACALATVAFVPGRAPARRSPGGTGCVPLS